MNELDERAVSNNRCSDAGSRIAASATALACASLSCPARNASAVSGNDSNRRAVSNARVAAPTDSPVAFANQCAALGCSEVFQVMPSSTRSATRPRFATENRSHWVKTSTSSLAPATSRAPGSSSSAISARRERAYRAFSNTLATPLTSSKPGPDTGSDQDFRGSGPRLVERVFDCQPPIGAILGQPTFGL